MNPQPRCPTCHRLLKRSSLQNAAYWALLHQIAEKVRPKGQEFSAETWHEWCKSKFHEDLKTFSCWVGYNFFGGEEFEYFITPMIGAAVGRTDGIAPGLEFTLSYVGFELYSESEYLFDFASSEYNFFYSWTDLTYSPLDWLWFGISGQITKVKETELETDRGLILGAAYRNFEITGYFYNAFTDDAFFMLALGTEFEQLTLSINY